MKYLIVYQPAAETELEVIFSQAFENFPLTAKTWCGSLLDSIETLSTNPERCPIAPESHKFDQLIRHLLYGGGKRPYRILFVVDDCKVRILHIRFPGQPLSF